MLKACVKLLITGIIMILVGVIGIGVLMGTGMIDEDDLSIDFGSSSSNTYAYESAVDSGYYDGDGYYSAVIDTKDADIKSLDIDIGTGTFTLVKSEEFIITAENAQKDRFSYGIHDGCLYVKYSPEFSLMSLDFSAYGGDTNIILTVPEKVFDSVSLNMTAGEIAAQEISTNRLITKVTAGSMYLSDIYAESATFKMSAGDFNATNSTFKNAAIAMTAGDMFFGDCKLYGDNNIKMTAGELQMCLIGNRQDYKINIDKALGDVYINGTDMGEYAETTFATTVLTEVTVTGGSLSHDDRTGEGELVEQEDRDRISDNEKPNGSIDINMTAGNCYIEFLGGE
ncbi:MAG: DUF4097 domain-containing protein [Oscillospiraceae bacterium]|nr:DUF4097 domain-containing protein [Oscillospiraceae bacterium]